MNNEITTLSFLQDEKANSKKAKRLWYPFYVGIDIGADFHMASCIPLDSFRDGTWKRKKTMKFDADSMGISDFLKALFQIQEQFGVKPEDFFVLLEPTGGHYSYLIQS